MVGVKVGEGVSVDVFVGVDVGVSVGVVVGVYVAVSVNVGGIRRVGDGCKGKGLRGVLGSLMIKTIRTNTPTDNTRKSTVMPSYKLEARLLDIARADMHANKVASGES